MSKAIETSHYFG